MALADNAHTRVVNFLKITLTLGALALLATMFLFARAPISDSTIPYAEIEDIARESRVSAPEITGVTEDGSVVTITADIARPEGDVIHIDGIAAFIDATDGTDIELTAGVGSYDNAAQTAYLTDLARLVTSNGYRMETTGLIADLETGVVESDGPLEIQTPFGSLTAGHVRVETGGPGTGAGIVFNEGVRLIYQPQQQDSDP